MPLKRCQADDQPGWKWGDSGKCYIYTPGNEESEKNARKKALAQAAAAGAFPGTGKGKQSEAAPTAAELAAKLAAEATAKQAATKPHGDVEYADPGYLDGAWTQAADTGLAPVARHALDTAEQVQAAWSFLSKKEHADRYTASQRKMIRARIKAAAERLNVSLTEAMIDGSPSWSDITEWVREEIQADEQERSGRLYVYCFIADLTDNQVVYSCSADDPADQVLWQRSWTINDAGEVTLGERTQVVRTYAPAPASMSAGEATPPEPQPAPASERMAFDGRLVESGDHIEGQLLAAKGKDDDGRRVFGVRIIAYGDSKNGRRYPETVMRTAIPLYEGAKAYDHHRTEAELRTSTITGMVGWYADVHGTAEGLEADLHLLPNATHAAEALDAALAAQERGLTTPLVGISHDVQARYRSIVDGARHLQEATEIVKVNSADIVAEPAAGGQATRMVAGGTGDPDPTNPPAGEGPASTKEAQVGETAQTATATAAPPAAPNYSLEQVLALLRTASPAQLAEATGLAAPAQATEAGGGRPVTVRKDAFFGKLMIEQKVTDAGLPQPTVEAIYNALPDQITEAAVDAHIVAIKASLGVLERAQLAPSAGVKVTKEAYDKKAKALDAMFQGDYAHGYRSIKEAFCDFTGLRPSSFDEDFNRRILRESLGGFDSALVRTPESLTSSSWNVVLGDSITRRMVAEYNQPSLQTWRQVVSSIVPVNDFRAQRVERIGGYGVLPAVAQGGTYNPLTSPTNEEVTYTISKRGGTEDVTLEMIANDDVRAIQRIPVKLGLAAAQTLYRFTWDILDTNPLIYDGVALFAAGHNNTAATALSGANLSAARLGMRSQAAFGDTSNILSLVPRTLIVVNDLEELGFELSTSAVALPTGAPVGAASNIPNLHQGLNLLIVDYWASALKWIVVADPNLCPTIEIGFYAGRETPELFTQADPSVGSVFTADKITYKIRHIYSGAVLDFRGFYRGNT